MKSVMTACLALVLVQTAAAAPPPKGPGVGVVLGAPTGGTFRLFLTGNRSLDLGVGYSGDATLWADHAWHSWDVFPQPRSGQFEGWVSAGVRLETADDAQFAVRTLLGASYWLPGNPVELFATAGPVFKMTPEGGVGADGGVGVRFYFGGLDGK